MFRLVTLNLNGIRSAANKGFVPFAEGLAADCMGVQEIKAQLCDIEGRLDKVAGMAGHFHCAEKKGYSGVGLYSRKTPSDVILGIADAEFDAWTLATGVVGFASALSPYRGGTRVYERKLDGAQEPHLIALKRKREFVLCGDVNIAHTANDLKNWRSNQKNSGFLPEERAWMTHALDEIGLVDVFRTLNPHPEQYTWWSNRGQAWAKNVGWRLDYHLATPGIAAKALREHIYLQERFSDHAPLVIDYDVKL